MNPLAISSTSPHPLCFSDKVTLAGLELTEIRLPLPLCVEVLGFKYNGWVVVMHAFILSRREAEVGRSLTSRPALSIERVFQDSWELLVRS